MEEYIPVEWDQIDELADMMSDHISNDFQLAMGIVEGLNHRMLRLLKIEALRRQNYYVALELRRIEREKFIDKIK